MKKVLAVFASLLLLSGCAGTTGATEGPADQVSAQPSENLKACGLFASTTARMEAALNGRGSTPADEAWGTLRDEFDTASLKAVGDVKDRLSTLVAAWPTYVDAYAKTDSLHSLNDQIMSTARACEVDDAPVSVHTFVVN